MKRNIQKKKKNKLCANRRKMSSARLIFIASLRSDFYSKRYEQK